ncbi:MAG: hypothetical protein RM368_23705 [Nostoc sp. DedSLP03]|uniref:hypothetical protein n=1 Tax=Nostoc sp. DedSLP03 TaxID=3075400 RepID=UPI002AD408BD|nr:hypothetical protein [Nostoc sp. DedSLP03]MDZ7967925.1 hypothetical protein [Nostoc sp. DedSLP03]
MSVVDIANRLHEDSLAQTASILANYCCKSTWYKNRKRYIPVLFYTERITVMAIAQRVPDKQLHGLVLSWRFCDCFASLAMTYKKVRCSQQKTGSAIAIS